MTFYPRLINSGYTARLAQPRFTHGFFFCKQILRRVGCSYRLCLVVPVTSCVDLQRKEEWLHYYSAVLVCIQTFQQDKCCKWGRLTALKSNYINNVNAWCNSLLRLPPVLFLGSIVRDLRSSEVTWLAYRMNICLFVAVVLYCAHLSPAFLLQCSTPRFIAPWFEPASFSNNYIDHCDGFKCNVILTPVSKRRLLAVTEDNQILLVGKVCTAGP